MPKTCDVSCPRCGFGKNLGFDRRKTFRLETGEEIDYWSWGDLLRDLRKRGLDDRPPRQSIDYVRLACSRCLKVVDVEVAPRDGGSAKSVANGFLGCILAVAFAALMPKLGYFVFDAWWGGLVGLVAGLSLAFLLALFIIRDVAVKTESVPPADFEPCCPDCDSELVEFTALDRPPCPQCGQESLDVRVGSLIID